MLRKPKDNSKAVAAFLARKVEIDAMMARLTKLSADHFNADPERIDWGDVGTLGFYATGLKQLTDSAFREGEYAE